MKTISNRKTALQKIRRETGCPATVVAKHLDAEYERCQDWTKATAAVIEINKPETRDQSDAQTVSPPALTPEERLEAIKAGELPYDPEHLTADELNEHDVHTPLVNASATVGVTDLVYTGKPMGTPAAALKHAEVWIEKYAKADEDGRRALLGWKAKGKARTRHDATSPKREAKARQPRAPREDGKLSMMEAAIKVMGDAKKPLNVKDILALAEEKGLWSPGDGKTPANTLYASFLREVNVKADAARIRKAGAGLWELA